MNEKKTHIKVVSKNNKNIQFEVEINFYEVEGSFFIDLKAEDEENLFIESDSYWNCFTELRKLYEVKDLLFTCQGARINAFPSGMNMSMGGLSTTIRYLNKPSQEKDIVYIFDIAPFESIGTIKEQEIFMKKWLEPKRNRNYDIPKSKYKNKKEWLNRRRKNPPN